MDKRKISLSQVANGDLKHGDLKANLCTRDKMQVELNSNTCLGAYMNQGLTNALLVPNSQEWKTQAQLGDLTPSLPFTSQLVPMEKPPRFYLSWVLWQKAHPGPTTPFIIPAPEKLIRSWTNLKDDTRWQQLTLQITGQAVNHSQCHRGSKQDGRQITL